MALKEEINLKLKKGESSMCASEPIIGITGTGKDTYLWVGNNSKVSKGCYATVSGMKTLEKFAFDLLKALGHKPNWLLPEKKKLKSKTK